jgi:predicted RNase H-like nuclease
LTIAKIFRVKANIVGIDCATDSSKVGLALGEVEGDAVRLLQVAIGERGQVMSNVIDKWTEGLGAVLLALDAPLGWPKTMSDSLASHSAGEPFATEANMLFRRKTDRVVKERVGKTPLDVGADRIARTAHAALELLQDLRKRTGFPIRLTWTTQLDQVLSAIEVYPAATLHVLGLTSSGYKRKADRGKRSKILEGLADHMELPDDREAMLDNADALDAAICVLSAGDFLRNKCIKPDDLKQARKEGWIWVREPE